MKKKKLKVRPVDCHGSLPGPENIAYEDHRGSDRQDEADMNFTEVPDGVSGYW